MSGPQHLPGRGTPWNKLYDALIEDAKAGNKSASDRLYDSTIGCMQFNNIMHILQLELASNQDVVEMSAQQISRELKSNSAQRTVFDENVDTCSGVARQELMAHIYPIILATANNGNEQAAVCYASGAYGMPQGAGDEDNALAQWRDHTLAFMHGGIRRGDWKMVSLMIDYFSPETLTVPLGESESWQGEQFSKDAYFAYKLVLLSQIGARNNADFRNQERMDAYASNLREKSDFSATQVSNAERWAQQMYRQHFAGRQWVSGWTMEQCASGG